MTQHIIEKLQIAAGFVPVNLATGANDGDYVCLKNYGRCAIVFFAAAGTAGDDPVLTVEQAKDVGGTGVKPLNFTRIDVKQGTLTAIGTFTKITQSAAETYTHADAAEAQKIWLVDIAADDLDVAGGFDCLRAGIGDVGTNAQIGALLYLLHDPRYVADPLSTAIAN